MKIDPDFNIDVIIPAFNEEASVGRVIDDIPEELVRETIVINNNSTDATASTAQGRGATVLAESFQGYGASCLRGIDYLKSKDVPPNIVVFIDADYSDYPEQMVDLIKPIREENYDMVIGSRAKGSRESGAMMPQQVFGNWLATTLIKWIHGVKYSDLGPFRAIKYDRLIELGMMDKTYGWTVEMQVKAAKKKMKVAEVPVDYRKRIGKSKITGTVKGTMMAGYKIIMTIFRYL